MIDVLMSIRPSHSRAILDGAKTVELRRKRPSFSAGSRVVVYATSPERRVQGWFEVAGVREDAPDGLWSALAERTGIDKSTFDAYFADCPVAYAIEVRNPRRISPAQLPFRPPQSYQFLDRSRPAHRALLGMALPS